MKNQEDLMMSTIEGLTTHNQEPPNAISLLFLFHLQIEGIVDNM